MKKSFVFLLMVFCFFTNTYALDDTSAVPSDAMGVLSKIESGLGIKSSDKKTTAKIYGLIDYAFKDNWYCFWVDSNSLSARKTKTNGNNVSVTIINDHNVYTLDFTYYEKDKQIQLIRRQLSSATQDVVMNKYNEKKADKNVEKLVEKDNYAVFQKTGMIDYSLFTVNGDKGHIVYVDSTVIDI